MKSLPVLGKVYKYKHEMTGPVMVMRIENNRVLTSHLFWSERLQDGYRNHLIDQFMKDYVIHDGSCHHPILAARFDHQKMRRINLLCELHETKCFWKLPKLLPNGALAFEKQ